MDQVRRSQGMGSGHQGQEHSLRTHEIESIRENAARVIVIRMKNATGPAIAEMLCGSMPRITRFVATTPAPFVAAITSNGALRKIWPRDAGHEEDA